MAMFSRVSQGDKVKTPVSPGTGPKRKGLKFPENRKGGHMDTTFRNCPLKLKSRISTFSVNVGTIMSKIHSQAPIKVTSVQ